MRTLRIAVLALAVGALSAFPVQPGFTAGSPEGCVVTNPPNPQFGNPCTYKATVSGGIAGIGTFKVTIKRGKKKKVYTNKQGNNWAFGTIKKGDTVTAQAISPGSFVTTGNPCPQSIPGAC